MVMDNDEDNEYDDKDNDNDDQEDDDDLSYMSSHVTVYIFSSQSASWLQHTPLLS